MAGAGGPDHVCAARFRDLHREVPDPSRRGEDRARAGRAGRPAVSTSACQAVSPASGSAAASTSLEAVGDPRELARGRGDVLGIGGRLTREARHPEHPISRSKRVTPPPSSSTTPATSQPTVNGGSPRKPPRVRTFQSTGIDPGRGDADEYLRRSCDRARDVGDLEHLRAAERSLADDAHGLLVRHFTVLPGWRRLLYTA